MIFNIHFSAEQKFLDLLTAVLERRSTIMSAISDFVAKQESFNTRLETAVQGLGGDVKGLNDLIKELQASSGTVTPGDQALLDKAEAQSAALVAKFEALDALTPPAAPPPGPPVVPPVV